MARSELNFNTGTLVNPFEGLQEAVVAGGIFSQVMKANAEQKQQDKILAERAAERAEAKAERDQDRAERQARYKVEDFRVEKADAEKARTSDIITSLNRDMSNDGMSTTMTPEQIAALTAQAAKYSGDQNAAYSDTATADMYNNLVEQNKANTAHAIKYGKDLNSTSYAPATVLSDGKTTVEADPLIYSSQKEKLLKPMEEGYAMSIYSKNPKLSLDSIVSKYKKDTGMEMDAGIQDKIQANIKTDKQLAMQAEQNRIARETKNEIKEQNRLEKKSKKESEGEYIRGLQNSLADADPSAVFEMKNGKPIMEKNPYPTGPDDQMIPKLKIGATGVKYLEDKYKEITSKQSKENDYYNDVLKDIPGHLAKVAGKKVDYISEGTLLDAQQLLSRYDTPKEKVEALKKIEPYLEDRWGGLEYFGASQIPNKTRKELGLK